MLRQAPFIFGLVLASLLPAAQAEDLVSGHYELHIDYDPTQSDPDDGWGFFVSSDSDNDFNDDDGITRRDPANVRLVASPASLREINSATSRLGPIGDPLWVLPQQQVPETLYLGFRNVIDIGIFQISDNGNFTPSFFGNIILEMVSVTGSGPDSGGEFAMIESRAQGNLEYHFDTTDGLDGNDRLEPVIVGGHTHYNWAMTQPGTYFVTFRASGRLNAGNQDTSAEGTYTFLVPHVPSDISLSHDTVLETSSAGSLVGFLSAIDPDTDDPITYTLADSAGGRFAINGDRLEVADGNLLDAAQPTHDIEVTATDSFGYASTETLTVNVVSNPLSVPEPSAIGTIFSLALITLIGRRRRGRAY